MSAQFARDVIPIRQELLDLKSDYTEVIFASAMIGVCSVFACVCSLLSGTMRSTFRTPCAHTLVLCLTRFRFLPITSPPKSAGEP